ncbi:MAG: hypothetical protein QM786_17885 [Breznakibacter sp.]
MRRLGLLFFAFLAVSFVVKAQTQEAGDIARMWTYPAVYKYDEAASWYFDLAGTTFTDGQDIYIWIWSPSEPDAGNWENSSEFAKLTYVGDMVWRFDLIPTEYFHMSSEDIAASAGFWLRLKDKTGAKQSGVASIAYTNFSDFANAGELVRAYPARPSLTAPLSILFNSNQLGSFAGASSVHMHAGLNDWDVQQQYQAWLPEIVEKTKLKDLGNGIYKMDLIPMTYFGVDEFYEMENIAFLFVRDNWAATTPDQKLFAANVVPPPPPALRFFPLKISQKDILGISRTNNERGVTKLVYTITAGAKTIHGEFSGARSEIKGFVNLVTELQGLTGLTKINIVIKDNNDREIADTDIPLVPLD